MYARERNAVYRSATDQRSPTDQSFSKTATLLVHLEFRSRLEDYVEGKAKQPVALAPAACHTNCSVGRWLHGEDGKNCKDRGLIDSLCRSCEEFYEAASEAVLLMQMGNTEMAKAVVFDGETIARASDRFQMNLSRLHQQCSSESPHLAPLSAPAVQPDQ